jgi:hypothetical protein
MNSELQAEVLRELTIGPARGGRRPAPPLDISVVRALGAEDLPELAAPPPVGSAPGLLSRIRHSHHLLARLMAEGRPQEECALISGFSPSWISNLKGDPAFNELLAYYQTQREQVFIDVAERMKVLGLSTLDELQHRLEIAPDDWSRRELMELADLMLLRGRQMGTAQAPSTPTINVRFVNEAPQPPVIELCEAPKALHG